MCRAVGTVHFRCHSLFFMPSSSMIMGRSCPVVQDTILRPVAYTGSKVSSTVSFGYRYTLSRQTI